MFLEKIEISGFKSFAQKTALEFPRPTEGPSLVNGDAPNGSRGVACVVGPNGSGKSNIVDAVRWVLGEQSMKSLRSKRAEDVIFSGSEKKSRLGMAEVALYLNNEDRALSVDYDNVIISRKVYRSGESEYRVNKGLVRLQDIILMLARANFGQKSYSIVSQGTIDQVIMATPADRKDYFDEAVGVKQFQLKRDQSINKLETAWNNLRQVDALLTEITPRLNSLTRQVKRLEKREKVEAQIRSISQRYYGWLWHDLKRKVDEISPKIVSHQTQLTTEDRELRLLRGELSRLEKEESSSDAFSVLQQRYQKVLEQKNKLREEQLMLQNKIDLAKQRSQTFVPLALPEIVKRLRELEVLHTQLLEALSSGDAAAFGRAKKLTNELTSKLSKLLTDLEKPKNGNSGAPSIDADLLKDLRAVTGELAKIEPQLEMAQHELSGFNARADQQKGKFFELQRKLTVKQEEYNKVSAASSELRVEMARLEQRSHDLKNEIREEMKDLNWLDDYKAEKIDESGLRNEMLSLKHQLELIGGVDPETVKEYQETKERHDFLSGQAEDLRTSITSLEKVITDLDEKIQDQFDTAFKHINHEFTKFFKILFGGGKAELILIKADDKEKEEKVASEMDNGEGGEENKFGILEKLAAAEDKLSPKRFLKKRTGKVVAGIDIIATPPGKKVSSITMLSGGERSLASIALICAVIYNNPSPFVILDEVDAALDEANSARFAKIVAELAHKTQFIVITHNRATMHQASVLYGVTMGDDGVSRLISLKFEEAARIVRQ